MNTIVRQVKRGHVEVPADWPEGMTVEVTALNGVHEKVGMDDSEWRVDPESIRLAVQRIRKLEPVVYTSKQQREMDEWNAKMKAYNIEAVRKQMGLEPKK